MGIMLDESFTVSVHWLLIPTPWHVHVSRVQALDVTSTAAVDNWPNAD